MALDTGMCVSMSVRIFFFRGQSSKSSSYYEVVAGIFLQRNILFFLYFFRFKALQAMVFKTFMHRIQF